MKKVICVEDPESFRTVMPEPGETGRIWGRSCNLLMPVGPQDTGFGGTAKPIILLVYIPQNPSSFW